VTATIADLYRQRCSVWSDVQGHLPTLYQLVVDGDAKVVVELGVRSAVSTAALLAGVDRTGGHLTSIDVHLAPQDVYTPLKRAAGPAWSFIIGDDLAAIDQLPAEIDLVFVDTSHTLAQTRAELAAYGPRSKVLALHDVELEKPDASPPDDPPFPVRVAVDEYVAATGRSVEYHAGSYGLAIIR